VGENVPDKNEKILHEIEDLDLEDEEHKLRLLLAEYSFSKEFEDEVIERIDRTFKLFLSTLAEDLVTSFNAFLERLEKTKMTEVKKHQSKLVGVTLLGLSFLVSVGISAYLYTQGLSAIGEFFIYPAILSLIMLALVLFRKEEIF